MGVKVTISRRAQARLRDIATWTLENFGAERALTYEDELLSRIKALEAGTAHLRRLDQITGQKRHHAIHIIQAGMHLFFMLKTQDGFLIADILHSRSDLSAHGDNLRE